MRSLHQQEYRRKKSCCCGTKENKSIYDFEVMAQGNKPVKLEEYKGERCFVITHLFFPERAGNLNGIYPPKNWLRGPQLERLEGMCRKYVNTMWFSGHSHWEWQLQKYQDRANIYREYKGTEPASGWCVHIPACGCPITSDGSSRDNNESGSEGALIKVYKNHVDVLGLDLKAGKYLPIATYRLS